MYDVEEQVMGGALELAEAARAAGDVPVGAIVVQRIAESGGRELAGGAGNRAGVAVEGEQAGAVWRIVGKGYNVRERDGDPAGHAEIVALRAAAAALGRWRLDDCELYVTLEPCTMCAGAIVAARIGRVIFGAWDPKAGAAGSVRDVLRDSRLNHECEVVGGIRESECGDQLRAFFGRS